MLISWLQTRSEKRITGTSRRWDAGANKISKHVRATHHTFETFRFDSLPNVEFAFSLFCFKLARSSINIFSLLHPQHQEATSLPSLQLLRSSNSVPNMIFEKTASTVSTLLSRRLLRHGPTTVMLFFLITALTISFISYTITTSMFLAPIASLLFSLSSRTPTPPKPPDSVFKNSHMFGPSLNATYLQQARAHINYAALPFRRPEADLLLSYLKPTDIYFEYGASATTLSIPHLVHQAFSIDHDPSVCAGISAEMLSHPSLSNTLRAFCAPVPSGQAAWAVKSHLEEGTFRVFRNYVDFPRTNLSNHKFDRVLINGRARVACALRILPQLKEDSLVFFHDFFLRPQHYAAVLPFFHEVARVVATGPVTGYTDEPMGMVVLRPRKQYVQGSTVPESRIEAIYSSYEEETPSAATTGVDIAYGHGLMRTGEGAFPYYEMARKFSKETARDRVILDLIALPFIALTYLVLRDIFNKVFLDAIASGTGMRVFARGKRSQGLLVTQGGSSASAKSE